MKLAPTTVEAWPALAWLARYEAGTPFVTVRHGRRVEVREGWLCEAVWDAPFEAGDFDRTDIVFGSGIRQREDEVLFVSSGAPVDRLHVLRDENGGWVSNSLPCLLAATGARLDPAGCDYMRNLRSVGKGLEWAGGPLPSSAGKIELVYHDNLRWDGRSLHRAPKPRPVRDFGSYDGFLGFLNGALAAMSRNLSAPGRHPPYRMLGTLSTGYDSTAAAALARRHGLEEAITFDEGVASLHRLDERKSDTGAEVGRRLGLRVTEISSQAWRRAGPDAAVPFLAGDGNGMLALFKGAEDRLPGRVLLTGLAGDAFWAGRRVPARGTFDLHGAPGGLALSEYRLWIGFIHVPVPYMGAVQVEDLQRLSGSEAMAAWSVGGGYDRPLCRRIVEEAGVPRELFGMSKKGARVRFSERGTFWSSDFVGDYLSWLREEQGSWWRRGRIPPHWVAMAARPVQNLLASLVRLLRERHGVPVRRVPVTRRMEYLASRESLYRYLFPWAVDRCTSRYRSGDGDPESGGAA